MKTFVPALATLAALSVCAPAFAASRGSLVQVPPLITKGETKSNLPSTMLRLPTQAGKVSKMVTTNLVAKGPSWIAKGDHYYSLCVPNRRMVACAPIVATSVMQGIEVGALADPKRGAVLTFTMTPGSKLTPKRFAYAIQFFLARSYKQVAHFNRMAVSYSPAAGARSLRVGPRSNVVDGGGGGCSYDDDGSYDCSGGDSGGYDGGDYGGSTDPVPDPASSPSEPTDPASSPSEPTGQCEGDCTYPSGNNNGDPDPCIAPNGDACPVVIIPGERPSGEVPASMPTCSPTSPISIECNTAPPIVGGEPQDLPKGPTPWFPQAMCNLARIFCSAGQEPDNDRGDNSELSGKTLDQLYEICDHINAVEMGVCETNLKIGYLDYPGYKACAQSATERLFGCRQTARQATDNGAHPAP